MAKDITQKIANLAKMSRAEIQALWLELYGRASKLPSRRDFVIRLLAYRLQEKAYGGLSQATRRQLRALADKIEADPNAELLGDSGIKPGIRLVREWKGKVHTVTVTGNGFVHQGQRYRSLSEVARQITGTRWSGPRFFGLKNALKRPTGASDGV